MPYYGRDIPRPDLGPNVGPFPIIKMSKNFPKWCRSFPFSKFYILVKISRKSKEKYQSYRCMKNCTKMRIKHVFIQIFVRFFMNFYGGQLKQQICYSFTLIISFMVFNLLKRWSIFLDFIKFSQF